jgi:hypothetical protein
LGDATRGAHSRSQQYAGGKLDEAKSARLVFQQIYKLPFFLPSIGGWLPCPAAAVAIAQRRRVV